VTGRARLGLALEDNGAGAELLTPAWLPRVGRTSIKYSLYNPPGGPTRGRALYRKMQRALLNERRSRKAAQVAPTHQNQTRSCRPKQHHILTVMACNRCYARKFADARLFP
jgi:hypothetical protein